MIIDENPEITTESPVDCSDVSLPSKGMENVVAIDVETANEQRRSICQVGLAWFSEGQIETRAWLVQPPANRYEDVNIGVHGITPEMTSNVPRLRDLWSEMEPFLEGRTIIAHNANFDIDCLEKALQHYKMDFGKRATGCTLRMARSLTLDTPNNKLPTLCDYYGISLERHHDADADAKACLMLAKRLWKDSDFESFANFVAATDKESDKKRSWNPNHTINEPNAPATDRQIGYIRRLREEAGHFGSYNYAGMTRSEASALIERLKQPQSRYLRTAPRTPPEHQSARQQWRIFTEWIQDLFNRR